MLPLVVAALFSASDDGATFLSDDLPRLAETTRVALWLRRDCGREQIATWQAATPTIAYTYAQPMENVVAGLL